MDKQPAMSFSGDYGFEMETVELTTEKENLNDHMWLFNNIPWGNHDNKCAIVRFDKPIKTYLIEMDGFDDLTIEITTFKFDNVKILAMHGFAGNVYSFDFRLGEEKMNYTHDISMFDFSKKGLKKRFLKVQKRKISGFKNQIKRTKTVIKRLKEL